MGGLLYGICSSAPTRRIGRGHPCERAPSATFAPARLAPTITNPSSFMAHSLWCTVQTRLAFVARSRNERKCRSIVRRYPLHQSPTPRSVTSGEETNRDLRQRRVRV